MFPWAGQLLVMESDTESHLRLCGYCCSIVDLDGGKKVPTPEQSDSKISTSTNYAREHHALRILSSLESQIEDDA